MKYSKFESQTRLFKNFKRLNENMGKSGRPYNELSPEDKELFNQLFDYNPNDTWDTIRSAAGPDYEGNYFKTMDFRDWDSPEGKAFRQELENKVQKFNAESQGHNMELKGFQDWDIEPGERTWDASWTFTFYPKQM